MYWLICQLETWSSKSLILHHMVNSIHIHADYNIRYAGILLWLTLKLNCACKTVKTDCNYLREAKSISLEKASAKSQEYHHFTHAHTLACPCWQERSFSLGVVYSCLDQLISAEADCLACQNVHFSQHPKLAVWMGTWPTSKQLLQSSVHGLHSFKSQSASNLSNQKHSIVKKYTEFRSWTVQEQSNLPKWFPKQFPAFQKWS